MFAIKQFVPEYVCLNCDGCCRFLEEDSMWQPALLEEEAKLYSKDSACKDGVSRDKKINPQCSKGSFYCYFFDIRDNKCKVYQNRPFECRLYPFLINRTEEGTYLAVDLKCPFIKDKLNKKEFKEYLNYLISFLGLPVIAFALKQNPQIFHDYSVDTNVQNLATLIF
jgi:Fe-S-cluster containining protein